MNRTLLKTKAESSTSGDNQDRGSKLLSSGRLEERIEVRATIFRLIQHFPTSNLFTVGETPRTLLGGPEMKLPRWISAVVQLQVLFFSKSDVQDDTNEEKDGQSGTGEELAFVDSAPAQASNVSSVQYEGTVPAGNPPEKPLNRKRRGKDVGVKPEQQMSKARGVSPSPRRLEEATSQAELTEEVKSERQVAIGVLTLSAGAIISAKVTTIGRQPAAGWQEMSQLGFCFLASIAMWFTSLLISLLAILLASFKQKSPGLVMYAKIINFFSICIAVFGVAFWIFS